MWNENVDLGNNGLSIISGRSNPELSKRIADWLKLPICETEIGNFFNDEIRIKIGNVRGCDVYVVQTLASTEHASVNDNIIELLLLLDAATRASARSVSALIPHFGYAKQEKKVQGREPVSARVISNLITISGAKSIITMDLHAAAIQGFFNISVDNLFAGKLLLSALIDHYGVDITNKNIVKVLSPDKGGLARARWAAEYLDLLLALAYKSRPKTDVAEVTELLGEVEGFILLTLDDMISTGDTLKKVARTTIIEKGAKGMIAIATHSSPKKGAIESILAEPGIKSLIVGDTIPVSQDIKIPDGKKLMVVDTSALFALAIAENQKTRGSVSHIFDMLPLEIGLRYWVRTSEGETFVDKTEEK